MITGSYVGRDGGVHANAVGIVTDLAVDVIASVSKIEVSIYHDADAYLNKNKSSRSTLNKVNLIDKALVSSVNGAEVYALTQSAFSGWKQSADPVKPPVSVPTPPKASE